LFFARYTSKKYSDLGTSGTGLTRVVNRNNAKIGLFHSKQSVEPR
jgi:hypothetical protein